MLDFKKVFGPVLAILGIAVILFACVAFLSDERPVLGFEVTKLESLVPFLVGLIFFYAGLGLIKST